MESNMQVFVRAFLPRKGVCYPKAKYVNIPCKLVQTEIANRSTDVFSAQALNELWQQHKRINAEPFWQMNVADAQKMKYTFL
jgi:hypothetical protein